MAHLRSLATRTVARHSLNYRLLSTCIAHSLCIQPAISSRNLARPAALAIKQRCYASDSGLSGGKSPAEQASDLLSRGVNELARGDAQSALDCFTQALSIRPTGDLYYNAGVCHYSLGNVDQALESWERALDIDPNQADAHVNAGNVYFMNKKDAKSAIKHMVKAVELAPADGEIQFNLACMYEATDQLESAIKMYDRAASNGLEKAKTHMRNAVAKQMKKLSKS